jgi:hypothetical protein
VHVSLAFSISHFVSSVGADAGFAAIIGLAILVLLYFAQARETSTLRDEATAANQRVGELERRVAQIGRPGVAPAPRPAGATAPATGQQAAVPLVSGQPATASQPLPVPAGAPRPMAIPAAPAGVGAPALIDATRLIPTLEPVLQGAVATVDPEGAEKPIDGAGEPGGAASEPAAPAASLGSPPAAESPAPATAAPSPAKPPPATAAAGAAEHAARPAAPGSNGTGEHPATQPVAASRSAEDPPAGATAPRRVQIRPGGTVPPSLSLGGSATQSPARRWLPVVLGVLIVGAIVAVLLVVTMNNGGTKAHKTAGSPTTNAPPPATRHVFNPSTVTVSVLNGTDVSQLAHKVSQKLSGTGYHEGTVATAADQTHTSTIIGYLHGFKHDGVEVATALKLPTTSVQPADQSAQAVACPPPAACRANVIVTVGSDLSSTP